MSGEGMMMRNKQVVLKRYVEGLPKESDFEVKISSIKSEIPQGTKAAVLVKNLYLACDPYLRHQMSQDDHSDNIDLLVPFKLGSVMEGFGVCNVLKSSDPAFKEGDYVWGVTGWEEYSLIQNPATSILFKITADQPDVPLSYYTGILGMVGLTAYVGIFNVCRPKEGEVVYVSTAAGGTGMLAGQFAKMLGAYVVGSTSTNEKVDILLNKLGFDDAFNYKQEPNFAAALKRCCPKGIDVYFDNVGGPMLDEVIGHMNLHGRIGICGMISQYSLKEPDGIRNLFRVITKCLRVEGFTEIDNWHLVPTYTKWVLEKLKEKKLVYIEDISNGLDNAPSALVSIFNGKNIGKKVVSVQES
ncbi:unnamed protein product [Cuscuta campestris]|uniref:Enoyl reductase (ER) domain-containing protein n=1 Tax=Cuscuta campestris TaxID=132261 RepID=A0A484M6Q1_9ASTE|nr:unnamed protein product [Cuscuta campestris]